jgi:hypothetical protein
VEAQYNNALFVFIINDFPRVAGTYTMGQANSHLAALFIPDIYNIQNFNGFPNGLGGSVTFTSIYPYYVGTFNFNFSDTVQVTDGFFLLRAY